MKSRFHEPLKETFTHFLPIVRTFVNHFVFDEIQCVCDHYYMIELLLPSLSHFESNRVFSTHFYSFGRWFLFTTCASYICRFRLIHIEYHCRSFSLVRVFYFLFNTSDSWCFFLDIFNISLNPLMPFHLTFYFLVAVSFCPFLYCAKKDAKNREKLHTEWKNSNAKSKCMKYENDVHRTQKYYTHHHMSDSLLFYVIRFLIAPYILLVLVLARLERCFDRMFFGKRFFLIRCICFMPILTSLVEWMVGSGRRVKWMRKKTTSSQ